MVGNKSSKRDLAIRRGLGFIYQTACDPDNFASYGFDYLFCFHCIASTSRDAELRRTALHLGRQLAHRWRQEHPKVPNGVEADDVATLIMGSYAADRLGVRDDALEQQLREVAVGFASRDYFCFDPGTEPPPKDVPDECECGAYNPRGRKRCLDCRKRLTMMSSYGVWLDALVRSYIGQHYVKFGASFAEVIKWLPSMRPYPKFADGDNPDFHWAVYAVTHVVYTLNGYSLYHLSPSWLPQEYAFLKGNLKRAFALEDPEMMGELLDTLKSFGLPEDHPLIVKGLQYLLSTQNADGSWGDTDAEDIYQRYHPTWTAIDGLRDYRWRGERPNFKRIKPLIEGRAVKRGVRSLTNS